MTMMFWDGNGSWGVGALVIAGFCVVMMVRMMGHGMHGSHTRESFGNTPDVPERVLANRLAQGEIDIQEYESLLAALRRASEPDRM